MPSSGYVHVFWQIPVDCCCRVRCSLVGTLPIVRNEAASISIPFLPTSSGSGGGWGRAGGVEAGGALVSTLNGPSERHSSLKEHVAPRFAFRVKASGGAGAE
eukprot:5196647-Prymnesium_polylepis.1